jgi:hypothetical protein
MRWWNEHVGMRFPVEHKHIKKYRSPMEAPVVRPGSTLTWSIPALAGLRSILAGGVEGALALMIGFVLFHIVSCTRFKHLQLSKYRFSTERLIRAFCTKGKRQVKGYRPGFEWAAPRVLYPGRRLLDPVVRYLDGRPADLPWVMPDCAMSSSRPLEASTPIYESEMSLARYTDLLKSLCRQFSLSEDLAALAGSRTTRRALATAREVMRLDASWGDALGDWVERVQGEAGKQGRASLSMALHYAKEKVDSAGEIKLAVWAPIWASDS